MINNLNKKLDNLNRQPQKSKGRFKALRRILVIAMILAIAVALPARGVYSGAKQLSAYSKALSAAYKSQNFDAIKSEVTASKGAMQSIDTSLKFLIWLNAIPFVGGYYQDIRGFADAGVSELTAAQTLIDSLEPYKAELGFNGQQIAGQDRVTQGLKILDKSLANLDKIQVNLKDASDSVKDVNVDKYPETFRGFKVRSQLKLAKDFITGSYAAVSGGKQALQITPNALGQNGAKTYLILFQNDKEIRPTGGFITAYAFLNIDHGKITTTQSDDIYRLDERLQAVCQSKICPLSPPAPIVKYLPEVSGKARSSWSLRDSNISPDLPTAAHEFETMYQLLGQGLPFDGIIFIDSQVVEDLIAITGPIDVYGTPYSASLDSRCNCPNVIFELENYSEIAAKGTQDRKAILGVLMSQLLAKSVGADITKIPQFLQAIVTLANQKHFIFYMHDDKQESALSSLNWTGQIKNYDGDYLHINDANFAGGKSNLYVVQTVTQDIGHDKAGIRKKITVEYKNPQPFNIWLNGINRDYVRFYVPKGSKLISSKGSEETVTTTEDLGKTVFEAFITVRPQNSRKLEVEYTIPYQQSGGYKLLIQKQPGAKEFEYKININGRQVQDFILDADKEFKLNL